MEKEIVREIINSDGIDEEMEEYFEVQYDVNDGKLLYLHQGYYSSCLFTKDEALQLRDFINKHFVD